MRFISENDGDSRPIWMSPEEINNPSEYINQFCSLHSLADCRFYLWQMLSNSVSVKTPHIHASPGEQVYFFENLIPLIESVFLLYNTEVEQVANLKEHTPDTDTEGLLSGQDSAESQSNVSIFSGNDKPSRLRKKQKKLKRHSVWYRERINDPFQVIHDFFDFASLMNFKANFYEILKATCEDNFYQKGSPNNVLHCLEKFESMINVAYLLNGEDLGHRFVNSESDDKKTFPTNHEMYHSLLSMEQIADPREVLASFFEYKSLKGWKETLIEISDFALSKHPAHEWGVWIDILPVFVHSVKLAEALYMIGCTHKEEQVTVPR